MKLKVFNKNILYVTFANQKELTLTMVRPQEFYECRSTRLRGKVFTHLELLEHYLDKNGHLDYFNIWSGFNLPGDILEHFFKRFELTNREKKLYNLTLPYSKEPYYFIATKKNDDETLKHELVHAHYYLNPVYKQAANILVKHMRKDLYKSIVGVLKEKGYSNGVLVDEINAYMATSGIKYLRECFDLPVKKEDLKPFEQLVKTVL